MTFVSQGEDGGFNGVEVRVVFCSPVDFAGCHMPRGYSNGYATVDFYLPKCCRVGSVLTSIVGINYKERDIVLPHAISFPLMNS